MIKNIFKKWLIKKPIAATAEEWDQWEDDNKRKHPVKYFLQETTVDIIRDAFHLYFRPLKRFKWFILHRFHPKHTYYKVSTGLKPGYYDPETQMLHAAFNLLVEFVENNIEWQQVDWEWTEHHSKAWKEMRDLYIWWKGRETREDRFDLKHPFPELPKEWGGMPFLKDKYKDEPLVKEWMEVSDIHTKQEEVWEKEDEEMFIRLIKVRKYMWY